MKLTGLQWLAISALLIATSAVNAETRPQYGGVLHVSMSFSPLLLEPADISDSTAGRNLATLLYDTLITIDEAGRPHGSLAESWRIAGERRTEFHIRGNVSFPDGTLLTAEAVAASLRRSNAAWHVTTAGDLVTIESNLSSTELLHELALPRNAIARRDSNISGTGPFHIVEWQAGKKLTIAANEHYWGGRPFLDQIEIDLGRSYRDQMNALESGRADLVEVAPEQMHRIFSGRYEMLHSNPIQLIALKFAGDPKSEAEKTARQALRLSIERESMHSVLLQGAGQPSASLLPTWMSGYGFVFPAASDLERARQLRDQIPGVPSFKLGYDSGDALARLLAERIALNAKDAGLWVQLNASATDLRLERIAIASSAPWISLEELNRQLGLATVPDSPASVEQLYAAEQKILASDRVIPLFHLPVSYASSMNLRAWRVTGEGTLDLVNAWLKSAQP